MADHPTDADKGGAASFVLVRSDRTVRFGEREQKFTRTEFRALVYLVDRAGTLVKREQFYKEAWEKNFFPETNTVDVFMTRIRKKLATLELPPQYTITTVRGKGYIFGPVASTGTD